MSASNASHSSHSCVIGSTSITLQPEEAKAREVCLSPFNKQYSSGLPQLQLVSSEVPKDPRYGFVFGSSRFLSDVHLDAKYHNISRRHFSIKFGDGGKVLLTDSSTTGTKVTYDDQQSDWKKDYTWVLFPSSSYRVIIHAGDVQFRIYWSQQSTRYSGNYSIPPAPDLLHNQDQSIATPPQHPAEYSTYLIVQELGHGSFGQVYLVKDDSTGSEYAGKKLYSSDSMVEVDILQHISHVNIVSYKGFAKNMLMMEYLPLGNLQSQHNKSRLSYDETVQLLLQSLEALNYLHNQNIAHRDLKPANILVQQRNPLIIKLADFGLAKNGLLLTSKVGTVFYAAPEVWDKDPYSHKVDIWSLGVVITEVAFGLPEWRGPEQLYSSFLDRIASHRGNALGDLLANTMLVMDPGQRYSASDCLREAQKLTISTWTQSQPLSGHGFAMEI